MPTSSKSLSGSMRICWSPVSPVLLEDKRLKAHDGRLCFFLGVFTPPPQRALLGARKVLHRLSGLP
jgi:hypothetical protein